MDGCPQCDVEHPRGAPDCPAQRIGRTLAGRYRVERLLGIGGMGAVYAARHVELGTPVAIKALRGRVAPSAEAVERFEREARELAALRHPGIVEVRDLGRDEGGMPFMAMELLEGENLADRLARGPIGVDAIVRLAIEALDALAEAHAHSIVHRDLKPANLFLAQTRDGERLKVLDFGIAKVMNSGATTLTETGLMMGSAPYMSPEQTSDAKHIDGRSDLYAMGATLFELLTGRLSAEGASTVMVVVRIAKGDIQRHPATFRPDVPAWLDAVVAKALATHPADRFQSALEMKRALQEGMRAVTLAGAAYSPLHAQLPAPASAAALVTPAELAVTAPATPPPSGTPAPAVSRVAAAPPRRRSLAIPIGATVAVVVVAAVVALPGPDATRPPNRAQASATEEAPMKTVTQAPPSPPAPSPAPSPPPRVEHAAITTPVSQPSPEPVLRAITRAKAPRVARAPSPAKAPPEAVPSPPMPATPPRPEAPPSQNADARGQVLLTFDQNDEPLWPTREEGLPTFPSMSEVLERLFALRPAVSRCAPGHQIETRFEVAGATGRPRRIVLRGFAGTPEQAACVAAAIRTASFPRFRTLTFPVTHVFPR